MENVLLDIFEYFHSPYQKQVDKLLNPLTLPILLVFFLRLSILRHPSSVFLFICSSFVFRSFVFRPSSFIHRPSSIAIVPHLSGSVK